MEWIDHGRNRVGLSFLPNGTVRYTIIFKMGRYDSRGGVSGSDPRSRMCYEPHGERIDGSSSPENILNVLKEKGAYSVLEDSCLRRTPVKLALSQRN